MNLIYKLDGVNKIFAFFFLLFFFFFFKENLINFIK
jgi:hypothetical protein